MKKKVLTAILITVAGVTSAVPAVSAFNGVRAVGMGGAFIAVADDVQSVYWNPAGMVNIKEKQLGWQRVLTNRNSSNHLDAAQFAMPLDRKSGLGIMYSKVSDTYDPADNWRYDCNAWSLSYGRKISETVAIGATVRSGKETEDGIGNDYYNADIGMLYTASPKLTFGLLINDVTGSVQMIRGPREVRWNPAVAYRPDEKTIIAFDVSNLTEAYNEKREYSVGIEHKVNHSLAIRAGSFRGSPTYGIGITATKDMEISFAYMGDGHYSGRKLIGIRTTF